VKKIPGVFMRDNSTHDRLITDMPNPKSLWVLIPNCEGTPYRKYDGTACMIEDGVLFARYDAKVHTFGEDLGKPVRRKMPFGFRPCQEPDVVTGHWPGWVPVNDDPRFKWHLDAWKRHNRGVGMSNGTYELCGPKIGVNAEDIPVHVLIPHTQEPIPESADPLRTFEGIRFFFEKGPKMEGLVFHHPDGKMAKITRQMYGLPWPVKTH
jgi:hypothetical protein